MGLTASQQQAADKLVSFLLNQEAEEIVLSGGAGTGKSYITSWFIKEGHRTYLKKCRELGIEPRFRSLPIVTATTNKAATVLSESLNKNVCTIHSFLGLKVKENLETGSTSLKETSKSCLKSDTIIFIDECSMINSALYSYIKKFLINCKIIYVGDMYQLAPVREKVSPIFRPDIEVIELTENVRLKTYPQLLDLAAQLRETVKTTSFKSIVVDNKVIQHLKDAELKELIDSEFLEPSVHNKIVTYTNKKTIMFNDYLKFDLRKYDDSFIVGEIYTLSNALITNGITILGTDAEIIINKVSDGGVYQPGDVPIELAKLEVTVVNCGMQATIYAAKDTAQLLCALKSESKKKNWRNYFSIKESVADLRLSDASTIHKAQGSTYKNIIVDLGDLSTCRNPDTAARLLYVACTRATENVYLYGNLSAKYGSLDIWRPA